MNARALIVDIVLATDLSRHIEYVNKLRLLAARKGHALTSGLGSDWASPFLDPSEVDTSLLLCAVIKWADLGHVAKPTRLHVAWTELVTQEFWALGDHERQLGMPISPFCDRHKDSNIAKNQVGFFKFVCIPFYSVMADLIDRQMQPWLQLQDNLRYWEKTMK
mmetsp:Transcript_23687/g.53869  ORF Transcript_23687/g.53869 Transcript_23687/m.53869 type:complete len:163 (-) Transcript_23687:1596-2084(-)